MEFIKKLFSPIVYILRLIQNYFKSFIFLFIVFLFMSSSDTGNIKPANLIKINVHGAIMSADDILAQFDQANKDNIKGVLIDINSPGGAVAPSIEIAEAIKRLKLKKPVIVYGSGMMASGGYYSAIWGDKIIANKGSVVGSIGVILQGINIEELANKIGIKPQFTSAGDYKQMGTPFRKPLAHEKEELEKVINDIYLTFVKDVATARNLDVKNHKDFANAHIFTANQAQKVGLIDQVGTIFDAQNQLIALANVQDPVWKKEDKFDKFLDQMTTMFVSKITTEFFSTRLY
jgi:protease-4